MTWHPVTGSVQKWSRVTVTTWSCLFSSSMPFIFFFANKEWHIVHLTIYVSCCGTFMRQTCCDHLQSLPKVLERQFGFCFVALKVFGFEMKRRIWNDRAGFKPSSRWNMTPFSRTHPFRCDQKILEHKRFSHSTGFINHSVRLLNETINSPLCLRPEFQLLRLHSLLKMIKDRPESCL